MINLTVNKFVFSNFFRFQSLSHRGSNVILHGQPPLSGPTRLSPEPSLLMHMSPIKRGDTPNPYVNKPSTPDEQKFHPVSPIYPQYPPTFFSGLNTPDSSPKRIIVVEAIQDP